MYHSWWSHERGPDLNPVIPLEDILKNGSADNALPLVRALNVTKREHVHCWCCIPAGTIPLFSKPESGRLNWTTPPTFPNTPPPHRPDASPIHTPFSPSALQPTNPPTTHSSLAHIPWSPVLIWVETFWVLGGEGGGGGGRVLGWHKGGRRRNSEHSQPFLNKDMSGIQARLSEESLFFLLYLTWALSCSHSERRSSRSVCYTQRPLLLLTAHCAEEVCCVFSPIIGDKQ